MALPSTVPTARPTCFAVRVALAEAAVAFFDLCTTFFTALLTFVAVASAADFAFRLIVLAAGLVFKRRAVAVIDGFRLVRVVFLEVVFFKISPYGR